MRGIFFLFVSILLMALPNIGYSGGKGRITVTDRLVRPWDMDFLSEEQAIVSEKEGGLQIVNLLTGEKQSVNGLPADLDFRNKVGIGDNTGIFGVKLDPNFVRNRWVYLSYAAKKPNGKGTTTKVVRAKLRENTLGSLQTLFVATPFSEDRFHYGGGLVFGNDGKLYFTVGERLFTEADQPALPIAQNYRDRRGKIYRLNPDGSVPNDNPEFKAPSTPGVYALGIRAAQGLTLHPSTGEIWFSEHGTQQGDELNRLIAGANYGWPVITSGRYRATDYQPPKLADRQFTSPVWFWPHTVAPTGLTFYTGDEFPEWKGSLLIAGLSKGSLWRFEIREGEIHAVEELFIDERIRLRNIKQAPDGKLYMLTDEANGRILRLTKLDEE